MKKIIAVLSLAFVMFSCDVAQSLLSTYSLTQCEYKYNSVSNLSLGGVNLSSNNLASSVLALTSLFTKSNSALPLQFTLNLDVKNPGIQTALLNGLQYMLEIDGIEMTTGSIASKLQVASGQTSQLPINLNFDLRKAMSGQSADAIKNLAFNFAGVGNEPTKVTFKLKPSISVGGQQLQSPSYIPVSFSYGGKK